MADHQSIDSSTPSPFRPICGIYEIRCLVNGKVYIGSSANVPLRWRKHLADLDAGKHHSILLQRAWTKHGQDNFVFEILEEVDAERLIEVEQRYIDERRAHIPANGYNISPTAGSCRGCKHSDATRAKMAASQTGRKHAPETIEKLRLMKTGVTHSEETRRKIGDIGRGRKQSEESNAKRSASLMGRKRTPEQQARVTAALRGIKRSEEARRRISEAHKGIKLGPESIEKLRAALIGKNMKVRPEDIPLIKAMLAEGHTGQSVAERFSLSPSTVSNIKHNRFVGYQAGA